MMLCAMPATFLAVQSRFGPSAMWVTVPAWAVGAAATLNGVLLEQVVSQVMGTAVGSLLGMLLAIGVKKIEMIWLRQVVVLVCIFVVALMVFIELLRAPYKGFVVFNGGVQLAGLCFTFVVLLGMHDTLELDLQLGLGRCIAIIIGSTMMTAIHMLPVRPQSAVRVGGGLFSAVSVFSVLHACCSRTETNHRKCVLLFLDRLFLCDSKCRLL
jgi:hypothetical protein